ncbi:MAG: hypothetical protein ABIE23_03305 [archaeon]
MNLKNIFSKKRILFILLFSVLVLIGKQLNFSSVIGSEAQYFTFFQFFGPIAGGFLGAGIGAISVLVAELIEFIAVGKAFSFVNLFRLTPMLFAAVFFAVYARKKVKSKALMAVIPLACIFFFVMHPVGNQAWFYALYWLIPIATILFTKRLFFRSLGATFTAHAIGSTVWLYTIPMPATAWIALIPITAMERILFALGISVSFIAFNTVLAKLENLIPAEIVSIDYRYILSRNLFKLKA